MFKRSSRDLAVRYVERPSRELAMAFQNASTSARPGAPRRLARSANLLAQGFDAGADHFVRRMKMTA